MTEPMSRKDLEYWCDVALDPEARKVCATALAYLDAKERAERERDAADVVLKASGIALRDSEAACATMREALQMIIAGAKGLWPTGLCEDTLAASGAGENDAASERPKLDEPGAGAMSRLPPGSTGTTPLSDGDTQAATPAPHASEPLHGYIDSDAFLGSRLYNISEMLRYGEACVRDGWYEARTTAISSLPDDVKLALARRVLDSMKTTEEK